MVWFKTQWQDRFSHIAPDQSGMCNNIPQAKLSYALKCSLHMKDPDNYTSEECICYTYLFTFSPHPSLPPLTSFKQASHGHKLSFGW